MCWNILPFQFADVVLQQDGVIIISIYLTQIFIDFAIISAITMIVFVGKDKFGKEGNYQVILKRVELPVVPNDACEAKLRETRLGKYFKLDPSFMCAGKI